MASLPDQLNNHSWSALRAFFYYEGIDMPSALEPPKEFLRELFDYQPVTGELFWKVSRSNRVKVGTSAGCLNKQLGYVTIGIGYEGTNRRYYRHRLIHTWHHGTIPDDDNGNTMVVDHIDGTGIPHFDRIQNLRCGTSGQNALNKAMDVRNRYGATGIWQRPDTGRWTARIGMEGTKISLGTYDRMEDAVAARQAAEEQHFGAWARSRQTPSFAGLS